MEYYLNLADKLNETIVTKDLGENLTLQFHQLIDMLCDDVFSLEEKYQVSLLAEDILSKVRDFPDKLNGHSKK